MSKERKELKKLEKKREKAKKKQKAAKLGVFNVCGRRNVFEVWFGGRGIKIEPRLLVVYFKVWSGMVKKKKWKKCTFDLWRVRYSQFDLPILPISPCFHGARIAVLFVGPFSVSHRSLESDNEFTHNLLLPGDACCVTLIHYRVPISTEAQLSVPNGPCSTSQHTAAFPPFPFTSFWNGVIYNAWLDRYGRTYLSPIDLFWYLSFVLSGCTCCLNRADCLPHTGSGFRHEFSLFRLP